MNYPDGLPSTFEYKLLNKNNTSWEELPLSGGWFPDAFMGTMVALQNHYSNKNAFLPHSVIHSYDTMKLVGNGLRIQRIW